MKTIHHITPKFGDTFSFNCPVCGCAHMQQDEISREFWACQKGHLIYVSIYQSTAKTLNVVLIDYTDKTGDQHG